MVVNVGVWDCRARGHRAEAALPDPGGGRKSKYALRAGPFRVPASHGPPPTSGGGDRVCVGEGVCVCVCERERGGASQSMPFEQDPFASQPPTVAPPPQEEEIESV